MLFWIIAVALGLFVGALLVLAAVRGRDAEEPAAAYDLRVYRGQMEEVERDLARGAVGPEDAERLRTEIGRKILEADRALSRAGTGTGARGSVGVVLAAVAATVAGALALYAWVGAPGYPDMPIGERIAMAKRAQETRPGQSEMAAQAAANRPPLPQPDAQYAQLMDKLRAAVASRPDDITGQSLLAQNEARLGNFDAAIAAQRQVIGLKGASVTAEDHAALADLMVMATDGYVSPEAEAELNKALALNPEDGTSRFYSGLMNAQTGRPDIAFGIWRRLLEKGPQDAPWVPMLRAQIGALAAAAGVDYAPPPAPGTAPGAGPFAGGKGPTAADMANAADMTPEERQQMIRGMVDQLNDRLANDGGPAEDWARLIGALGVLGETDRAKAIYGEARGKFEGRPEDLAKLAAAAAQAGVAE